MGIVEGVMKSGMDEEVCVLADTVMQLLENVTITERIDCRANAVWQREVLWFLMIWTLLVSVRIVVLNNSFIV